MGWHVVTGESLLADAFEGIHLYVRPQTRSLGEAIAAFLIREAMTPVELHEMQSSQPYESSYMAETYQLYIAVGPKSTA